MFSFLEEEGHPLALRESLLATLHDSVGTHMFRRLYRDKDGTAEDVIHNGDLACAYFVSTVLMMYGLISDGVHTTVRETLEDMHRCGWTRVTEPELLAVVVWGEKVGDDGNRHFHIGICTDGEYAVEHSAVTKSPRIIPINGLTMPDGSPRTAIAFYVHPYVL